jgi:hypothetical protein
LATEADSAMMATLTRISHTANCSATEIGRSGEGDEEPWR